MSTEASAAASRVELYPWVKRLIDLVGGVVLFIAMSPIMLLTATIVCLDSRGPAIYRQVRVGRNGIEFTMLKFRTMKVGAPVLSTADMQKQAVKPFTRIGPVLRMTNLDEFPQLWNIIKGEMSFIGPRPPLPTQTDVVSMRKENGVDILRPGITGLAQVRGRDELDVNTKVGYDTEYLRHLGFGLDLKILFLTFGAVLSARGNK